MDIKELLSSSLFLGIAVSIGFFIIGVVKQDIRLMIISGVLLVVFLGALFEKYVEE